MLLALESGWDNPALVESATRLAAQLDAELLGLFVEDINLLRMAGMPFAHEVGLTSAVRRRLHSGEIEHMLRVQAQRAQRLLAASAERLHLRWSFQVVRGEIRASVNQALQGVDLVALVPGPGQVSRGSQASLLEHVWGSVACSLLVLPTVQALARPVAVFYDGTPQSDRALQMAAQLARSDDQAVQLIIAPTSADQSVRLQQQAHQVLQGSGARIQKRLLPIGGPESLALAINETGIATLLMPATPRLVDAGELRRFLGRIRCAVILVR